MLEGSSEVRREMMVGSCLMDCSMIVCRRDWCRGRDICLVFYLISSSC